MREDSLHLEPGKNMEECWGGSFRYVGDHHWTDFTHSGISNYKGAKFVAKHRQKILEHFEDKFKMLKV